MNCKFYINNADLKVLVVFDTEIYKKINPISNSIQSLQKMYNANQCLYPMPNSEFFSKNSIFCIQNVHWSDI